MLEIVSNLAEEDNKRKQVLEIQKEEDSIAWYLLSRLVELIIIQYTKSLDSMQIYSITIFTTLNTINFFLILIFVEPYFIKCINVMELKFNDKSGKNKLV